MADLQICCICGSSTMDLIKHTQKHHANKTTAAHKQQVYAQLNLYQCKCNRWIKSFKGLKQHLANARRREPNGGMHSTPEEYQQFTGTYNAQVPTPSRKSLARSPQFLSSPSSSDTGNPGSEGSDSSNDESELSSDEIIGAEESKSPEDTNYSPEIGNVSMIEEYPSPLPPTGDTDMEDSSDYIPPSKDISFTDGDTDDHSASDDEGLYNSQIEDWSSIVNANTEAAYTQLMGLPTTRAFLHQAVRREWIQAVERVCSQYIDAPSEINLLYILGLPKVGLAPGETRLAIGKVRQRLQNYPKVQLPQKQHQQNNNVAPSLQSKIHRKMIKGEQRQAARLLRGQNQRAPTDDDVISQLKALHPSGTRNPFGDIEGAFPGTIATSSIVKEIKRLPHDIGVGASGWTAPLMKIALHNPKFEHFITQLANQISAGTAPGRRVLTSAVLIPNRKPGTNIPRPIAIGELMYRVIAKAQLKTFTTDAMLAPNQFGVGKQGGVEPLIYLYETRAIAEMEDGYQSEIDFINAYNSINRTCIADGINQHAPAIIKPVKWAYNHKRLLMVKREDGTIETMEAENGVSQGDPWSAFLFSIAIRDTVEHITNVICEEGDEPTTYIDDFKAKLNSRNTFTRIVEYLSSPVIRAKTNLIINQRKTHCYPLSQIREQGTEIYGSFIGPTNARRPFLRAKISETRQHIKTLQSLYSQDGLLLLRNCISRDLAHLLRWMDTEDIAEEWIALDMEIQATLDHFRAGVTRSTEHESRREITTMLYSLPIRHGGVGILNYCITRARAREASIRSSVINLYRYLKVEVETLDVHSINPEIKLTQKELMEMEYQEHYRDLLIQLNQTQRTILSDQTNSIHAACSLTMPSTPKSTLSDREIGLFLRQRTLLPVNLNPTCTKCGLPYELNHQEACEATKHKRIERHNNLRDLIKDLTEQRYKSRLNATTVQLEPPILGNEELERVDLQIVGTGAPNETGNDIDITVVTITANRIQNTPQHVRQANTNDVNNPPAISKHWLDRKETTKINKYDGRTTYPFQVFGITTGGTTNKNFANFITKRLNKTNTFKRSAYHEISCLLIKSSAKISQAAN